MLILKINFSAICVYIGLLFSEIKANYQKIIKITLCGETIFTIYSGLKLFLIINKKFDSLDQIQNYWPFSLISFFPGYSIPSWLLYPLYAINIAQIIYWFFLAFAIGFLLKINYLKSFRIVLSSYGLGFLLWMLIVVFVQVYFLPTGNS